MAGMFYSLQEAAEKLRVSEEEVKQLAKNRKLREFRDGENIMFKIDEVESLAAKSSSLPIDVTDEVAPALEAEADLPLLEEDGESIVVDDNLDLDLEAPLLLDDDEPSSESTAVGDEDLDALLSLDTDSEDPAPALEEDVPSLEIEDDMPILTEEESVLEDDELTLEPELEIPAGETSDIDLLVDESQVDFGDTQVVSEAPTAADGEASVDDLLLSSDTNVEASLGGDTALTSEGLNVLGDTDGDYQLSDDTMAETLAGLGATGEASLEEIEDDVNLDSFGSGSGLLDLSLQADDTSLGGILDEIYTNEDDDVPPADTEEATADDMTAEVGELATADAMGDAEDMALAAPMLKPNMAAEIAPDASSNIIGALQFVSLAVLIYTALVAWAAARTSLLPSVASPIKGFIWIVMGGLIVVAMIWAGVGLSKGGSGDGAPRKKKASKSKKVKAKGKKEKPKKEKKPKEKKPKKGLFAKKK